MQEVTLKHFQKAIEDIKANGDNDMLPFDIDNRFISDNKDDLANIAFELFKNLDQIGKKKASKKLGSISVFTERLLSPTGTSGFRISTKIHPFWNFYLNGLAISIAEKNEKNRSTNAHSYRYNQTGPSLFNRDHSWRSYKQATLDSPALQETNAVVVQTDISSFYEHIYHHRIENCIGDLFSQHSTVASQVDRLLNHISSGRSFGLPVGGQCSRILAELLMTSVDQLLTQNGIIWHRYVDDFTLIANNQANAYKAISILSNILADFGLSLNRSKTIILKASHYENFIHAQLFSNDDKGSKLKEIDLYFDPYSDNPISDYDELTNTIEQLDIQTLLDLETHKSQPDSFLISQISRTLKLHSPSLSLQLCNTLLSPDNLHAFRASWSTIMRGINTLRSDKNYKSIYENLDKLIDEIITHSKHLLLPETNCLHFLRVLRNKKTNIRATFVYQNVLQKSNSETLKRACLNCMRYWKDRATFTQMRNKWNTLNSEAQRMLWLSSYEFGDAGKYFRQQVKNSLKNIWQLGFEEPNQLSFQELFTKWASKNAIS